MSQLRGADGAFAPGNSDDTSRGRTAGDAPDHADDRSAARADATGADATGNEAPGTQARGDVGARRRTALTVAAIIGVLAIPLVIATVAVRSPHWYPLVDMAQIEMRVRDVGPSHPPLIGLGGRIFGLDTQGSHPGPLGFYLLAPVYRLLGSSSWALQASATALNLAALAGTVWAAHRRWGLRGALLIAAGLGLLMRMYGTTVLLYPWNPYLPVLFWLLFLVCVWGVVCDDLPLLPVAVVAGSLCAQTHIAYVGLVGGMLALAAGALVLGYRRARGDAARRWWLVRWVAISVAIGIVLWLPVVVEQFGGHPGNLSVIIDSFRHPIDQPVGAATAWRLLTQHLNVVRLVQGDRIMPAPQGPGIALLVAWAVAAVAAVRLRDRTLVRLHVVVGVALALGFVTISRILGTTWFYLTLWAFGTATMTLLAVVATAAAAGAAIVSRRSDDPARVGRVTRTAVAALGVAVLAPTVLLARAAPGTEDTDAAVSEQLGRVVQPTVDAIEDGTVPGGGDGIYLMTWADPVNLGGQGLGLMLELERRGYDARAPESARLSVRGHRVAAPDEADAEIHVATGVPAIDSARAHPGSRQIAYHDPRTDAEAATYDEVRTTVIDGLQAAGLGELVPQVDGNLFGLAADQRLTPELSQAIYIMGITPQPVAVFTWEPTSG